MAAEPRILCLCCDLSDGSPGSGVSDGMFRKPSEGQSLISYLSEQDFGSCADLEKVSKRASRRGVKGTSALFRSILFRGPQENAHFSISESLIAAIELMKYNLQHQEEEGDSDSEIQQLKQKIRLRRQQIRRSRMLPPATSQHSEAAFKQEIGYKLSENKRLFFQLPTLSCSLSVLFFGDILCFSLSSPLHG